MNKLISILLALACLVSLLACAKEEEGGTNVYDIVASTKAPTKITTLVTYVMEDDTTLNGQYIQEIQGYNSIFRYTFTRLATLEESDPSLAPELQDPIKTVTGAIYNKDGKTYDVGENQWNSETPPAVPISFQMDADKLTNPTVSADGLSLTATVSGVNIAAVLGVDVKAVGDVALEVVVDGINLRSVNVSYETSTGAAVTIRTSYSYNVIELDFDHI